MLNKILKSFSINSLVSVYDLLFTHPILKKNIELKDKNKNEIAKLEVSFSKEDEKSFKIKIQDDGKGIDPKVISAVASKKEQLGHLDLKKMSDKWDTSIKDLEDNLEDLANYVVEGIIETIV